MIANPLAMVPEITTAHAVPSEPKALVMGMQSAPSVTAITAAHKGGSHGLPFRKKTDGQIDTIALVIPKIRRMRKKGHFDDQSYFKTSR